MDTDWTNARPCVICGELTPGPDPLCAFCDAGQDEGNDEDTDDPTEPWEDDLLDTAEELPCLHADGCPGHRRCLVCI